MTTPPGHPPLQPAPDPPPGRIGTWLLGAVVGAVVLALMAIAWGVGREDGRSEAAAAGGASAPAAERREPPDRPGAKLFVSTCGGCHTLDAAGTSGTAGPDLGALRPDAAQVQAAIEAGGAGSGAMPARLLSGEDARAVAEYVAAAAGPP